MVLKNSAGGSGTGTANQANSKKTLEIKDTHCNFKYFSQLDMDQQYNFSATAKMEISFKDTKTGWEQWSLNGLGVNFTDDQHLYCYGESATNKTEDDWKI